MHALYDDAMFQDEVLESLRANRSLSEPVRTEAIALAESIPEDPSRLNASSWGVVRHRDGTPQAIRRAVHASQVACRILTKSGSVFNTLGVAQYRAANYEDAVATLSGRHSITQSASDIPIRPTSLFWPCPTIASAVRSRPWGSWGVCERR